MAASSSSSGISLEEEYDVFLSFRGEDTRRNFTSHLYSALIRKNIRAFFDDQLIRGDKITPSLLKAIERSKIAVILFSKGYASSAWCLQELEQIRRCKNERGQIVLPVFYHVAPRDVRRQSGSFGAEFAMLEGRFKEKSDTWRTALTEVANLSGWDSSFVRFESVLLQQIVSDIYEKLNYLSLVKEKELVGVKRHIENIESLLSIGSKDVFTLGIWGIAGVGKSTIATVIYHRIYGQFDRYCFIDNVGERAERSDGLISLRQEILSAITLVDRNSPTNELPSMKGKSGSKKVLMVIDNVTQGGQIEFLIGGLGWFGPGSRILIITRDEQVLKECRVDKTYKVEGLLHAEALMLFNSYAFGDHNPGERYLELSKNVIVYAKGAPFVLIVLGSFLSGKRVQDWESTLNILERTPSTDFQKVLKICYDGLDDEAKKIFLDISSLLNGVDIDLVTRTLKARNNFPPEMGINALVNRHFITITNNKLLLCALCWEQTCDDFFWRFFGDGLTVEVLVKQCRKWWVVDIAAGGFLFLFGLQAFWV
ncbi:TMV resistance protein N-like [Pistacia vera]|uniref:TMV resistance protein N-like n=1 Tax=Pistacia vera TaxID=55513 RepID=UPI0012631159|nr:TMV resistance protein N-like [Pistacia vera]